MNYWRCYNWIIINLLFIALHLFSLGPVTSFHSTSTIFANKCNYRYSNNLFWQKEQKPYSGVGLCQLTTIASDDNLSDKVESNIIRFESQINRAIIDMTIQAIGSTTTIVVSAAFFAVLAWKRDAMMVSFFIGAISNGVLSKVLKKLINQTRPPELEQVKDIQLKPSDKGMPSSHAMSLGFISTFIACNVSWTQLPLAVYAIVSLIYRIQVKLHTWQQVVVGSIVGSANGFLWYRLCTGENPWQINIMNTVTKHFLNKNGQLPLPLMIVPFIVGAATIGSFERRISSWIKKKQ
jgi:PAP2 superfamily